MGAVEDAPGPPLRIMAPGAVADAGSRMRKGKLEQLVGADSWHPSMVVLAEDRFWYSQAPSAQGSMGGGMASVRLQDCDKVLEGEDKRQLQFITKNERLTFRTKNVKDRDAWLLAIVGQTALVKEKDILLQAEQIVAKMEMKKSSQHFCNLEAFSQLSGVLDGPLEARRLFIDFVHADHAAATADGKHGAHWPEERNAEALVAFLEANNSASSLPLGAGEAAEDAVAAVAPVKDAAVRSEGLSADEIASWSFIDTVLFPRFREHPVVQCRLCRIAAGLA